MGCLYGIMYDLNLCGLNSNIGPWLEGHSNAQGFQIIIMNLFPLKVYPQ